MEKTLLVICPGNETYQECAYSLLVEKTGECLYQHWCSNYHFAPGDLIFNCPDRIEEVEKRFGEFEVKFHNEVHISEAEMLKRNRQFFKENNHYADIQD